MDSSSSCRLEELVGGDKWPLLTVLSFSILIGSTPATVARSQGGNVVMFASGISLGVDERTNKILP